MLKKKIHQPEKGTELSISSLKTEKTLLRKMVMLHEYQNYEKNIQSKINNP